MAKKATFLFLVTVLGLAACNSKDKPDATPGKKTVANEPAVTELKTVDTKVGTGAEAVKGDTLIMNYTGKLADGTEFDSSEKPGKQPFSFVLGQGSVIKGWDQGMPGMKVGGKRKLSIPYKLGYGDAGQGPIPGKSDLYFDVTLLDVVKRGDVDKILEYPGAETVGKGPAAKAGDQVEIQYTGRLANDSEFDSTANRGNKPLSFTVGKQEVLPFIDETVVGMKAGGVRKVRVPPTFAAPTMMGGPTYEYFVIKLEKIKAGKGH